jgi:hypothetical protein
MTDDPPALHATNCRIDDCDWGTLGFDMPSLYADLGDHLVSEHDYTTEEWHDTLRSLKE